MPGSPYSSIAQWWCGRLLTVRFQVRVLVEEQQCTRSDLAMRLPVKQRELGSIPNECAKDDPSSVTSTTVVQILRIILELFERAE